MAQFVTCLWFDTQAEEAADFYCSIFPGSRILSVDAAPVDTPGGLRAGDVLTVEFWPTDPWDAGIAADWGSGAGRVADAGVLDLTVDAVTPQVPTVSGRLAARVTVTNTSDSAVGNIMIRAQRAERLPGSSQARTVLAEPEATYAVATSFGDSFSLAAGESATLTLEVALDVAAPAGLGVAEPGVYPLLFNANGRPDEGIDQFLAETRFLLPVRADDAPEDEEGAEGTDGPEGESGAAPEAPETPDAARDDAPADPVPMSLVWPLATNVPLLPGETGEAPERQRLILSDESLHEELGERGRLGGLLGALESELAGPAGPGLRQSTCVAVDPELIQTVDRMVDGYSVGDRRPSPVESSTRLRDSWGDADSLDFTEGSGAETAAQWLDRLRAITRDMCVVTLPWSGAEINAVSATGDPDLAAEALSVGDGVVADILELEPLAPVVLPPEGYLSATAAPTLRYADPTGAVDPNAVFEAIHGTAGADTWPSEGAAPATALVTANSLTPDDGGLAHAGESVDLQGHARAFALPGSLSAAMAATGSAPEVAGYSAVSGRHDLTADSGVARMQTSVGTLHQELSDASIRAGDGGADLPNVLIDQPVPYEVLLPVAYPKNMYSQVFRDLRDRPEFGDVAYRPRMFDDAGNLTDATVAEISRIPQGEVEGCGNQLIVGPDGTVGADIPLSSIIRLGDWVLELNAISSEPLDVRLSLPNPFESPEQTLAGSTVVGLDDELVQRWVSVSGGGNTLRVDVEDAPVGASVCIGSGAIGPLVPAEG